MKKTLAIWFILLAIALSACQSPLFATPVATATQTQVIPTLFVPTPDCGSPTLVLGSSTLQLQNLAPAQDGSWTVPADTSDIAYWVQGTDTHPVFVLSPTPQNLVIMSSTSIGTTAKVTLSNCNSATYSLSAAQAGVLDIPALSGQSTEGITIFFQTDASGAGFVYTGELTEQQINTINTPAASDIQAEISLLGTTASADGTTITISVSIQNFGTTPITLSSGDVSLLNQDSTPLMMVSSEPALPKEIGSGATEALSLTFPRPVSPIATLKIFSAEYDIEGY